jgi:YidC/Oxa1 family membrane protein insertase
MSESQRIFLAFILCTGIFLGFQWLNPSPPPIETADNSPNQTAVAPGADAAVDGGFASAPPSVAAQPQAPRPVPAGPALASRPFSTPLLRGTLQNGAVGLSQLQLVNFQDRVNNADGTPATVSLVPAVEHALQAQLAWHVDSQEPVALDFVDASGLRLRGQTGDGLRIEVEVKPREQAYALDYVLRVTNTAAVPHRAGASVWLGLVSKSAQESRRPSFFGKLLGRSAPAESAPEAQEEVTAVCEVAGSLKRKTYGDVKNGPWTTQDKAAWMGLDQQYFALAVVPREAEAGAACTVRTAGDALTSRFIFPEVPLPPGGVWERGFSLYAGPKRDDQLSRVSPVLRDIIDYNLLKVPLGFLARPMVWLLDALHGATGSWGLAIMLLTVTVKLLLFPVTYKSLTSAKRMQALKPELDALKTRFPDDKERQQMEQLKLFKERGVNPVGGCLPMLLQMPVWITLYRTLWSDVDLYQQPFLWLQDLTAREPIPSLAIAVGALTVLQQKVTPMAMDNQQAKVMMWVMPVMLTVFMVPLPSGLVLYILVNSILTILQQLAINKRAVTV